MNETTLADAIRLGLGGGLLLGLFSVTGRAQDQAADPAQLDRITITGSRIKRAEIESASPLLIIEREEIERTGLTSIGELLQDLPIAGSAINTRFNNGGDGSTHLDLRNLGPQRVLVLLNGRRFVSNSEGIVDLNNIPIAVIKRVEVLKDGASSIYGSDAIAGVVNVITRDDYEGMQANAYIGQYASDNDGEIQAYDFGVGTTSDRGSVFFNASYAQQESIFAGDRRISAEPQFGTGVAFGSFVTPQGTFCSFSVPDMGCFGPRGVQLFTTDPGTNVTGPGGLGAAAFRPGDFFPSGQPGTGTDRYNFAPANYALTPQERTNIFTQASYEVADSVRLKIEATYNDRQSAQLLAPLPMLLGFFFFPIPVAADNAFNPFGVDLPGSSYLLTRRLLEGGPRVFTQDVDSYRFGLGFEGNFQLGHRYFDWDANYVYADLRRSDRDTGRINAVRLTRALSGQPCRDDAFADGCVELNLFGGQGPDGAGTITQAMLDYIFYTAQSRFSNTLTNYTANLSGDLFELPAGPLAFAVGYEYRLEEGSFTPDSVTASGTDLLNFAQPAGGDFSVDELYLELAVPLLAQVRGAERLDLSLSSRRSDYDPVGATTNSKIGLEWQPIDDLLLRATFSQGFRAPPINELFNPGDTSTFLVGNDPCSVDTDGDGVPDSNPGLPGCAGVPDGDLTGSEATVVSAPGSDLQPETSDSVTAGLVYSPSWLDGLDLSVDYYKIELEDSITNLGGFTIVSLCANTGVLCDRVLRDPVTGRLVRVEQGGLNLGGSEVEGVDFLLSYSFPESRWGYFRVVWDGAYQGTNSDTVVGRDVLDLVTINNLGVNRGVLDEGGFENIYPRWKANLNLQWSLGDWEANWGAQYVHATSEICAISPAFGFCNADLDGDGDPSDGRHIGAVTYHDVQVSYHLARFDARLTAGVQNLFDKGPPLSTGSFADGYNRAQYRVPGRFPYVRATVDF